MNEEILSAMRAQLQRISAQPPVPIAATPRFRQQLPGGSLDHEIEAARAGQVAECCGAGNEKRGAMDRPLSAKWKHYLAACAIVRDERDLPEWVAYQFTVGFEHVHIVDNESVTPVADRLRRWINDGRVSVSAISGRRQQNRAYTLALKNLPARWIAFIDADEFLLPHGTDDVKALLRSYEPYGGLGVTWQVFGSSGHVARPSGLVLESYERRGLATFNLRPGRPPYYKTIVQREFAAHCPNPHYFRYRLGKFAVNENCDRLSARVWAPASVEKIQLNHYMVKSAEDWRLKQERCGGASGRPRTAEEWAMIERSCNEIVDTRIQRFVPRVKELMAEFTPEALT